MVIAEEDMKNIVEILENIGTYLESVNEDMMMGELILDSMSLISFYVELEEKYNLFLPEDIYSKKLDEYSLSQFWTDIMTKATRVKVE